VLMDLKDHPHGGDRVYIMGEGDSGIWMILICVEGVGVWMYIVDPCDSSVHEYDEGVDIHAVPTAAKRTAWRAMSRSASLSTMTADRISHDLAGCAYRYSRLAQVTT
jgi:hypothetical protein